MTAKTPPSGMPAQVQTAAAGAVPTISNPPQGSERFERFLQAFADTGFHKRAAEAAGLTLEAVAARVDTDEVFAERYRIARRTRRFLVEDAVLEEALGVEHRDPVNGVTKRVRDRGVLQRLAVKDGVLDPEQKGPTVAIQNVQQGTTPEQRTVEQERERVLQAIKQDLLALTKADTRVIDAEVVTLAQPDPDGDLL